MLFYMMYLEGAMKDEISKTCRQSDGLAVESWIGSPAKAACDAQAKLAETTAEFIRTVGVESSGSGKVQTATFTFRKKRADESDDLSEREVSLQVPLLAIVPIPSLPVKDMDVHFDMDVKPSFPQEVVGKPDDEGNDSNITGGMMTWVKAGSCSIRKEGIPASHNPEKYHVHVQCRPSSEDMPEGLAKVIDIMSQSVQPIKADIEDDDEKPVKKQGRKKRL